VDRRTDIARWSDAKALEQAWDAEIAAAYVPAGVRVLDLGRGRIALRSIIIKLRRARSAALPAPRSTPCCATSRRPPDSGGTPT
jgi:hypothetical protein